jgi:hypothetical protein
MSISKHSSWWITLARRLPSNVAYCLVAPMTVDIGDPCRVLREPAREVRPMRELELPLPGAPTRTLPTAEQLLLGTVPDLGEREDYFVAAALRRWSPAHVRAVRETLRKWERFRRRGADRPKRPRLSDRGRVHRRTARARSQPGTAQRAASRHSQARRLLPDP